VLFGWVVGVGGGVCLGGIVCLGGVWSSAWEGRAARRKERPDSVKICTKPA